MASTSERGAGSMERITVGSPPSAIARRTTFVDIPEPTST
jgi:hypothetical protein